MIKVNGKVISEKEFDMACAEKKHLLRKNSLHKNEIEDVVKGTSKNSNYIYFNK